jgi:lipopolysaccharide export system protein LptC
VTPQHKDPAHDNLSRLLNLGRGRRVRVNRAYTFVVRSLRLLLPLAALTILTVVIIWPRMEKEIAPIPREDIIPQQTGRNELINPRFESMTAKMEPYTITAARAEQALDRQSLIVMENPVASLSLNSGLMLGAEGQKGTYDQDAQILILDEQVVLRHSDGYMLETAHLTIHIKNETAMTQTPVQISGPDMSLEAAGMKADQNKGLLFFTGPAKLVLMR